MPSGADRAGQGRMRPDPSGLAAEAMRRGQDLLLAGNPAEARRWLDRARRLAPDDAILDFLLATALLRLRDPTARPMLQHLAAAHDAREIWAALAAAAWQEGDVGAAVAAMGRALGRHAFAPGVAALAGRIATGAGLSGWCGLDGGGHLHVHAGGRLSLTLDGQAIAATGTGALPTGWRNAAHLAVHGDAGPLLGSPIDIAAIRRLEGCIVTEDGDASGWAWHPGDPDRDPRLIFQGGGGGTVELVATDPALLRHPAPLARPRLVRVPAETLAPLGG